MDNPILQNDTPQTNVNFLSEALQNLIDHLTHSEAFIRFRNAEQALMNDSTALDLLNQLARLQQTLKTQQRNNQPTEETLGHLRQLQLQVAEHPLIQDYEYSRETYIALIRQVNQQISQLIRLDFAALTRR
ncbi:uncharacterized conserved protein [Bellilinea caldifistulae]|uniref:YlbF family regulator n=1 Tax=Bellilinea caldifistulae TaxID=360411 RepID=A0A0P6XA92_9CHLR|nr:hypothetical protein AC812_03945 [Bellilinea caldifistulae]GAP10088.1 uncharacterized conserved protein [Bellilinea caldifistulae]